MRCGVHGPHARGQQPVLTAVAPRFTLAAMAYLDHIVACNTHDLGHYRPLFIGPQRVGWLRHPTAERLVTLTTLFVAGDGGGVALHPRLDSVESRSDALDEAARRLAAEGLAPAFRGERYGVAARWGLPALATVDRGVVSLFGMRSYGIHVNGVVRRPDGLHLWVGRRADDRPVAPGKLDNMVAGGQPAHLSLADNLVKEAAEEADLPETLARTAQPVGAIAYCCEDCWGLKPDVMFCYDLAVPDDFIPRNTDGEISGFTLMPATEVMTRVRDSFDFKFNVNLVILDFLIRHGMLSADNEPSYMQIVLELRRTC